MAVARSGRAQKASALLPLAVLSAAWTASLATAGSDASAVREPHGSCPTAPRCRPRQSRPPPASSPGLADPRLDGNADRVVSTASATGIPAVRAGGLPARRDRHQRRRPVLPPALAAGRRDRPRGVRPRPRRRQRPDQPRHREARHLRPGARRQARHHRASATPTPAGSTATRSSTARSARCSSSRRPGRSSASTPTATASATRRTSTTPRSARRSTSAPGPTTCRPTPGSAPRCSATTTASATSTWCWPSMHAYLAGDFSSVPNGTTNGRLQLRQPSERERPAPSAPRTSAITAATTTVTTRDGNPTGGPTTAPTGGPTTSPTTGPTGDPTTDPTHDPERAGDPADTAHLSSRRRSSRRPRRSPSASPRA